MPHNPSPAKNLFPDLPTESRRCEKCNRPLTDPESITLGMGPCCRTGEPYVTPYEIIVDTREQAPFFFDGLTMHKSRGGGEVQASIVIRGLPAGDYSIDGFESQIAIERKSKEDLYGTLGKGRDRFVRELEKLAQLRFAAIVIEGDWFDVMNTPPAHSLVPPQSIEGSVLALQQDFPTVQWQFAMHRRHAEWITFQWLDRFFRKQMKDTSRNVAKLAGSNGTNSEQSRPESSVL